MPLNSGYLIPENPSPSNNRCVRVYVPNDPLYMAALLGTLTYLGQWTAWERDALHRGSLAADSWKNANDLTLDGLSLPCSDNPITEEAMSEILDKLNDVISRLTEIEHMNITVTQTNGCCCDGDTTSTSTTTTSRTIDPEDTGIIPPYNTEPIDISDPMKCRTTNYLAKMVTETIRALAGRLGGGALLVLGIVEVLFFVLSWLDMIPGDEVVGTVIGMLGLITIAQAIARMAGTTMFTWGVLDELAEFLESPQVAEEFVCALSGWTNAEELGSLVTSFINSKIAELDTVQPVRDAMITVFGLLFDSPLINWFTQNSERIVPADFIPQYDCLCGATGDTCPTSNLALAGYGDVPSGDLTGTTENYNTVFNSKTGFYEIIFELAANYCVSIDYGNYTPEEMHEVCSDGVMVSSDGTCIRRFAARSQSPFATAVTFDGITENCYCINLDCIPSTLEMVNLLSATVVDNPQITINNFSVIGNRVIIDATRIGGGNPYDGIHMDFVFEQSGVELWLFDDMDATYPVTGLKFNEHSFGASPVIDGRYYMRWGSDLDACLNADGRINVFNTLRSIDYNHTYFTVYRATGSQQYHIEFDVVGFKPVAS